MILKKFRLQVYGVHFIIKTDAYVLVVQLNKSEIDLSGALITRQLIWIRLFNFDIRHIPKYKHTVIDGFLRRPPTEINNTRVEAEQSINDFINT